MPELVDAAAGARPGYARARACLLRLRLPVQLAAGSTEGMACERPLRRGGGRHRFRQGIKVLILVPTAELQRQWQVSLRRDLPSARRGDLGDSRSDSLDHVDILVAIVHSASNRETLVRTSPPPLHPENSMYDRVGSNTESILEHLGD